MEIGATSTASQAMFLKDNLSKVQLGVAAIKQNTEAQNKLTEMLAQQAQTVSPPAQAEPGRIDTYA